jgi:hypothetical protein
MDTKGLDVFDQDKKVLGRRGTRKRRRRGRRSALVKRREICVRRSGGRAEIAFQAI